MFKLSNIFRNKEIQNLKNQIIDLKLQFDEKQEVINKTNAYWKKKVYFLKDKKKDKS